MDERALWAKRCSETEQRKRNARLLYELEMECRRQGWDADTALRYDEEKDLFCFTDGRFASSREHADWSKSQRGRSMHSSSPI
jgi:hypothetical protein